MELIRKRSNYGNTYIFFKNVRSNPMHEATVMHDLSTCGIAIKRNWRNYILQLIALNKRNTTASNVSAPKSSAKKQI